jgi:hypothetical protein
MGGLFLMCSLKSTSEYLDRDWPSMNLEPTLQGMLVWNSRLIGKHNWPFQYSKSLHSFITQCGDKLHKTLKITWYGNLFSIQSIQGSLELWMEMNGRSIQRRPSFSLADVCKSYVLILSQTTSCKTHLCLINCIFHKLCKLNPNMRCHLCFVCPLQHPNS